MLRSSVTGPIGSKPFNVQLGYYLGQLQSSEDHIFNAEGLGKAMGIQISRKELEQLQMPSPEDGGLAPSDKFITKFVELLDKNSLFASPTARREFIGGAQATKLMAERRAWPIIQSTAHIVQPQLAPRYDAVLQMGAARRFNPHGKSEQKSALEIVDNCYREGKTFADCIAAMMKEWSVPDSLAFAEVINKNITKHVRGEKETIKPDMIRQWRKDEHRMLARAPIEQTQLFCKAFGLEVEQERMIWKMMRGKKFGVEEYDTLERQAKAAGNPGLLTQGLLDACGVPKSLILEATGANRLSDNVKGVKFDSRTKALAFVEYAFPAKLALQDHEDPAVVSRHERAAAMLADATLLPPVVMQRMSGKRTASQLLDEALKQGTGFGGFLESISKEWEASSGDLRELIAYNYRKQEGEDKTVWDSTLKAWMDKYKGMTDRPEVKPHPDGVATLRKGLMLDEASEGKLWYLIGGHEPKGIDTLVAQAVSTGDTGPLVRELVASSGIPTGHLEATLPTAQLHEWMNGGKISDANLAARLLEVVYPPRRRDTGEVDDTIISNHKAILEKLVYQGQVITDDMRQARSDHMLGVSEKDNKRVAAAVLATPFASILEATTKEKGGWNTTIHTALKTWGASPRQFSDAVANGNSPDGGTTPGATISLNAVHSWKDSPEIKAIAPESVAALVGGFKLKDEIQEQMIWKQKAGRYLKEGELEKAIKELNHEAPAKLVELLIESAGIQESRLKKMLGVSQIDKWFNGGFIKSRDTARRVVEVTLGVERSLMGDAERAKFDTETTDDIVRALTGRPLDIADIISHGYHGKIPENGHDFLKALCGPKGVKTLSDQEFADLADIGEWETRQVRRGGHALNREQARRLLKNISEKEGTAYTEGAPYEEAALNAMTTKPPPKGRARVEQPRERDSRATSTDEE